MNKRQGFGPLHLVVIIMIAVVVGLLAKGCEQRKHTPAPTPSTACATYGNITYCHQPASPTPPRQ